MLDRVDAKVSPLDIELHLLNLKLETLHLQRILIIKDFNRDQPRVPAGQSGGGQWVGDAYSEDSVVPKNPLPTRRTRLAARSQEFCDEQYKRDVFQCRMVGISGCYAQAMVRLVACERGHTIPPLNY